MISITINPGNKKLTIPKGLLLLDVLKEAGIIITTPCGGNGNCGKCKVIVLPQNSILNSNEKKWLTEEEKKKGFHLACQYYLNESCNVTLPLNLYINKEHSSIEGKIRYHRLNVHFKPTKEIKKVFIQLDHPSLLDQRSDWTRIKNELERQLKDVIDTWKVPITVLQQLPRLLRNSNFKITLTFFKDTIIDVEEGDTREELYGIAFDIGTTTIAGYLLNLSSMEEMAIEAFANPQFVYGDDVISRINYTQKEPRGRQKLQKKLIDTLNQVIFSLSEKVGIDYQKIYFAVLVGNTSMHHFLWSLPTENLAVSPYVPVVTEGILKESRDLFHFCLKPASKVYTAPNVSAYIGGDIIADMIDISIWKKTNNTLMIDLGTNGEIVLVSKGKIWTCSTAAGPAFEGARISSGMRAEEGAIDQINITKQKVIYHTIGQSLPLGICGSGIVDLVSALLRLGIILPNGRLINREECSKIIAKNIRERIIKGDKYNQFLVIPFEESSTGLPIYLTQKDIREIQLAKGAVMAGIRILLKKAKILLGDIDEILLAGAFGNVLNITTALEIGIIPTIPLDRIHSIGNAAGRGAEKLLLSEDMRIKAEELSKIVQYVELSSYYDFQKIFTESLRFGNNSF